MKHTPLPWAINQWRNITDTESNMISVCGVSMPTARVPDDHIGYANAAFIVQAVNSHDDLVAALEMLLPRFISVCPDVDGNTDKADLKRIDKCRAVLKLAKGEA